MANKLDPQALADLIEAFLCINPEPSDQQFHSLAESLGVDKETLEALSYQMLGEEVNEEQGVVEARSTHFDNESLLLDPDCEYSPVMEEEGTEHPGEVIINAQSTHFNVQDGIAAKQDGMDELFGTADTPFDRVGIGAALKLMSRLQAAHKAKAATSTEEILSGDYDEDTLTPEEMLLNDGQMEANNPNPGFQKEQTDDGATALDRGVGLEQTQMLQNNDGLVDPEIVNAD